MYVTSIVFIACKTNFENDMDKLHDTNKKHSFEFYNRNN